MNQFLEMKYHSPIRASIILDGNSPQEGEDTQ